MDHIRHLIEKYPDLAEVVSSIRQAFILLEVCYSAGGKVLVCGNGGSAADSEHIVAELMKGFYLKRPISAEMREVLNEYFPAEGSYLADHLQGALPVYSLVSQVSLTSSIANDGAADMVFAQQVFGYGQEGDGIIGLSTSGNSANVLNALRVGKALGLRTLGFTGKQGGRMEGVCDVLIRVPWDQTPDIQERHQAIYHALCGELEERFFKP